MTDPIRRLHDDHAHFSRLLTLLESEIDRIESMQHEDTELMRDAMTYIIRYSDRIHHPMEDLVYARLVDKSPHARERLSAVPRDHEQLIDEGRTLHECLVSICDGGLVERDKVVSLGRGYVAHLRKHMALEEEHFFPMAESILDAQDLAEVNSTLQSNRDPVFGPVVEKDFENLYQRIERDTDMPASST